MSPPPRVSRLSGAGTRPLWFTHDPPLVRQSKVRLCARPDGDHQGPDQAARAAARLALLADCAPGNRSESEIADCARVPRAFVAERPGGGQRDQAFWSCGPTEHRAAGTRPRVERVRSRRTRREAHTGASARLLRFSDVVRLAAARARSLRMRLLMHPALVFAGSKRGRTIFNMAGRHRCVAVCFREFGPGSGGEVKERGRAVARAGVETERGPEHWRG